MVYENVAVARARATIPTFVIMTKITCWRGANQNHSCGSSESNNSDFGYVYIYHFMMLWSWWP